MFTGRLISWMLAIKCVRRVLLSLLIFSKSEVIGLCGGDEKNEWPRRTDKSQTLKTI